MKENRSSLLHVNVFMQGSLVFKRHSLSFYHHGLMLEASKFPPASLRPWNPPTISILLSVSVVVVSSFRETKKKRCYFYMFLLKFMFIVLLFRSVSCNFIYIFFSLFCTASTAAKALEAATSSLASASTPAAKKQQEQSEIQRTAQKNVKLLL